jgi:hypothetical protein
MVIRSTIDVFGADEPITVIVEPWADEFVVHPGERCAVVAIHPSEAPTFSVAVVSGQLVVWVNEGGTTFEFLRDGQVEYATDNVVTPLP